MELRFGEPTVLALLVPATSAPIGLLVRVEDSDGSPVAGHRVELVSSAAHASSGKLRRVGGVGEAGPDGRCRARALVPGTKEIIVRGPGEGDVRDRSREVYGRTSSRPSRVTAHTVVSVEARKVVGVMEADVPEIVLTVALHDAALRAGDLFDERGMPIDDGGITTSDRDAVSCGADGLFEVLVPKGARTVQLSSPQFVGLPSLTDDTQFRQDIGTHRDPRAGGLRITLQDTADDPFVPGPIVRVEPGR